MITLIVVIAASVKFLTCIQRNLITTQTVQAFDYLSLQVHGVAKGVLAAGLNFASIQAQFEQMRQDALDKMRVDAARKGANSVLGMRYDTIASQGILEVTAYGTAVTLAPLKQLVVPH